MSGHSGVTGSVTELATDQSQKQHAEHKVKADKADQREQRIAVANYFAVAIGCAQKTIDQPGLASQLCRHPAQRVGDVWKWECKHQHPEQPCAGLQPAPQALEVR